MKAVILSTIQLQLSENYKEIFFNIDFLVIYSFLINVAAKKIAIF